MKLWIISLCFCVIFLAICCSYLKWKLQKLTERVNELSSLIAKGLNELREDYIKRGGLE